MYSVFLLSQVKNCIKSGDFCEVLKEAYRNLKCCVQRIKNGFCYRDIWNINDWFLNVMPDMLDELERTGHGFPLSFLKNANTASAEENDKAAEEWRKVLTEMAFLFREANEETCSRKNPYDKEYTEVLHSFFKRFGFNGKWVKKKDGTRVFVHRLDDIPKYKELCENYRKTEKELCKDRENCHRKALLMFAEYFNDLWD